MIILLSVTDIAASYLMMTSPVWCIYVCLKWSGITNTLPFCDNLLKASCLLDSKSIKVKFCGIADAVLSWVERGLPLKSMLEVAVKETAVVAERWPPPGG
jgi:hypothetical protein